VRRLLHTGPSPPTFHHTINPCALPGLQAPSSSSPRHKSNQIKFRRRPIPPPLRTARLGRFAAANHAPTCTPRTSLYSFSRCSILLPPAFGPTAGGSGQVVGRSGSADLSALAARCAGSRGVPWGSPAPRSILWGFWVFFFPGWNALPCLPRLARNRPRNAPSGASFASFFAGSTRCSVGSPGSFGRVLSDLGSRARLFCGSEEISWSVYNCLTI
jgi:hypothetical protein